MSVLDISARTGGPGPTHGWLGCCLHHDQQVEQEQDRQEAGLLLCGTCSVGVDPTADPDSLDPENPHEPPVCELCRIAAFDDEPADREPDWACV